MGYGKSRLAHGKCRTAAAITNYRSPTRALAAKEEFLGRILAEELEEVNVEV
jgi:hypothetical protein